MVAQVTAIRYKARHKNSPLSLPRGGYTKFRNGKPHSSVRESTPDIFYQTLNGVDDTTLRVEL